MSQLGVFMGRDLDPNHESRHFIRLNDWILSKYGGSWDRPPSLLEIQDFSPTRRKIIRRLAAATSGLQMIGYWGPHRYSQFKRQRFLRPWGWKDPRNAFTAWLWDEIFPDASYIYIVRCGIDVAQSLVKREHRIYRHYRLADRIQNFRRMLFDLLTIKRSIFDFLPHLNKTRLKASLNIGNIEGAFGLWETYSEASLKFLQNKADKNRQLQLNYEKLLEQPSKYIKMLADLSGLKISIAQEENIISKIDASRRFPFVKKPHLLEFYNAVRHSPLMKHYHYDDIL
jgi:hypothetical protein